MLASFIPTPSVLEKAKLETCMYLGNVGHEQKLSTDTEKQG